ncbi:metalloregulator ArsR/SmtB family transcription factor [bacterium]|nr:metalloregulator ArsR/SmtB family transcription factor [bacterium]
MIDSHTAVKIFRAFDDVNRIRILQLLRDSEKCACVLLEDLRIGQSTLSHHMKILCDAGIVKGRKDGKWMYYSVSEAGAQRAVKAIAEITGLSAPEGDKRETKKGMSDKKHEIYESVKQYYSDLTLNKGGQLASSVCCCPVSALSDQVKKIAAEIPDEINERYYGCGSPIPDGLSGRTVLDLGCGTGRDVYVASKLAGPTGEVIGVDMNDDQLAVAEKYKDEMADKWGFSNVRFIKGRIEDLAAAGIKDGSVDVVISNCVINLSPDKEKVFSEIRRVLKEGGMLYFSDIFADKKVPEEINSHPLLLGECLGGAMSYGEFKEVMRKNGWDGYEVVSSRQACIGNAEIERLTEGIKYTSDTVKAIKM